ncbi:MAG: dihydrolipoyl dehydrogenase [Pseudomonadota bacterium]
MTQKIDLLVPDIGDFADVEVIEVHVGSGDSVEAEDSLITLETDKATMDVPAPAAGTVASISVKVGDRISKGDLIGSLQTVESEDGGDTVRKPSIDETSSELSPIVGATQTSADTFDLVVLGAGPGGYSAAFRAADLGMNVALIERWPSLGGVCLNVGCIPSKALLHAAKVIDEAASMADHGIVFGKPKIDAVALRDWKQSVVERLTSGLSAMADKRKVTVIYGTGRFATANAIDVQADGETRRVEFKQCIIAAGSESVRLPSLPDDPRIVDSTGALELAPLPKNLLVVGGGIIGLEMACVYEALGVSVTVVELTDSLMPGTDKDLVRPLQKRLSKRYEGILLGVKVESMKSSKAGIEVVFSGKGTPDAQHFERVLLSVGRRPNGDQIGAENAGVAVTERGFIEVDKQMRTNVGHIFAIGDIVGQPMLAHKATHEAHVAAEVASGLKRAFDARVIPSVAYTDPEIAWVGLTEAEAKEQGVAYGVGKFPWAASGRSLANGRDEGFTKLLFDKKTDRLLGAGIVGTSAGDLISELALAIEMGADASDIAMTIHPHPTLGETVGLAAEVFEGTVTDLYVPKRG